ncbi:NAD(P)H-binding protein [Variovorax sp. RA8]|uniref:NAD(P)H-binding protein n=1 Tax=Variovorax sp. (strain JCM 16519 / RA8) TaxID=662548 RepID=UPI001317F2A4|nr:NAD(P)H-binding protein [Variovorax sp. RA8]VTU31987.1 Putative NADH-flavin reductase [Variovorax sp. RA8]
MNVLLFGATGMVGQGVLRECLLDPDVRRVLSVGRRATGVQHPKLHELVVPDLMDYSAVQKQLAGYDACFFCLGVSSVGMSEEDYRRVTCDITLAAARLLVRLNPQMSFIYVSGAGTDSSERGPRMWARVKGETENALMRLPFKAAYMFRPGFIQPLHGVRSRTAVYRWIYLLLGPLFGLVRRLAPNRVTTSEQLGRAMLVAAKRGARAPLVEMPDINALR